MGLNILEMGEGDLLKLQASDIHGALNVKEILHIAELFDAFWEYDEEKAINGMVGLHAELKSGLHSGRFFFSKALLASENICQIIANQMAMKLEPIFERLGATDWIVGVPNGATILGEKLGVFFGINVARMKKGDDGKISLETSIGLGDTIALVEDFFTKGTGFGEAVAEVIRKQPLACILPYNTVILNRGGSENFFVDNVGINVISVVNYKIEDWEPGECPLCALGSMAIKPKATDENWQLLINSQK